MKRFTLFLAAALVATALAGCADNGADVDDTNTTGTPTTPVGGTTPATPTDQGPGGPMQCEGDYVTEDEPGERLGLPELTFTIKEPDAEDPCYAFVGPASATAGWTVLTVEHPGREFHIMPMYFIGERTMADVLAAFASEGEPEWAVPSGAVGGLTGGENGSVALDLQEGAYVYFCPIGGHHMQGMMGILNVTAAEEERPEPTADLEVELVDFNFTIPQNVSADVSVIRVENTGAEAHEMPLARLAANTTAMEFLDALENPDATGPPPGALIGGVNAIAPGQVAYILVDLEPGTTYASACFVESHEHEVPHFMLGMLAEFNATDTASA